jgi:HAD superfamily hydrolase (TIGR01509 family)
VKWLTSIRDFPRNPLSRLIGGFMIKAALCDIDGTLVDSNWLHAAAWKDAFQIVGIELALEDVRKQIGKGGDELIPFFVPWWKRRVIDAPLKRYRKLVFRTEYLPQVKPFPMVRQLFQKMKESGIRVSLASSAHQGELDDYKRIADIADLVEKDTSSDDADRAKPHPDIFEATLSKLKISSGEALALGDTPYDAEAAGLAGVWTVGVTTGGWSSKELLAAGCIEVYRDVADLLTNFDRSAFVR